ncbi:GNAT family N-acetyltransferase [Paenibacillus protaetiae]|uniref:GNAT family N-acetyltransferase n=1 Tax=Paenibacillus protaetiae TaxID=2509456 RepID=A0A4P6EX98_9BACL|nr:GNAT family N-acetyltransferase [Paenibacillus protaetiae]QAY67376.1 GNAT family N-acetyltransferase [Paenibacillus protaetiae]
MPHIKSQSQPCEPQLTVVPMDAAHARHVCSWRYESPYNLYGWPAWEQMERDEFEFGSAAIRESQYVSIVTDKQELAGFGQLFPMAGVTRLGMGLRPDFCGQGLGAQLALLLAHEALKRKPDHEVDLEVLTWNERAIRAYTKAGFLITDTYFRPTPEGEAEFHCMVFQPQHCRPE